MQANEELDLQALGLFDDGEEAITDMSQVAEERSSLPRELPQPGVLRLRIPGSLAPEHFKQVTDSSGANRLTLSFKDDLAFQIQPSGQPLSYNITDFRNKTKEGAVISEFLSFIRATGYKGSLEGKKDMVLAVLAARGKDFMADLAYTATCNPKRSAWKEGKDMGKAGCGQTYTMKPRKYKRRDGVEVEEKQIPREPSGKWLAVFTCTTPGCEADVRAFAKLSNYRVAR